MKILLFLRRLLISKGLYPFDPQRVLQKLPLNFHRLMTPPTTEMSAINRTPTNLEEMTSMVKSLNSYTPNHKTKVNKVLKGFKTLHADLLITRDSTKNLFRANMSRETRKKKNTGYIPAYGRVLTEAEATRHREDEIKKQEIIKQKKELFEAKKLAVATKRLDAVAMRQVKQAQRAEKARIRDENKAIKTIEMIDRKRKREEAKMQKEVDRLSRPKRVYRKKLHQSSNQEDTPPVLVDPALQVEDSKARSPTPSMGGYVYPKSEFNVDFIDYFKANKCT